MIPRRRGRLCPYSPTEPEDVAAPTRGSGPARVREVADVDVKRWSLWSVEVPGGLLAVSARHVGGHAPAVVVEEVVP